MEVFVAWVLYALIATALFSGFFLWAVRSGQFSDQDRARYLPLAAASVPDDVEVREG